MHGFDRSFSGAFKTFDCCRCVAEDTLLRKSCASFPQPNFGFSLPNVANWFSLPLNQTCLRQFFHTPQWLKARERSRAADKSKFSRYSCGACFFFMFETPFYSISQTVPSKEIAWTWPMQFFAGLCFRQSSMTKSSLVHT